MSILLRRRALLTARSVPREGVLYDEGYTMEGLNFEHNTAWDIIGGSASVTFTKNASFIDNLGNTRTALRLSCISTTTNVAGMSAVESAGILGSELKRYSTLNATFSSNNSGFATNGRQFILHSSLSGNAWNTNQVTNIILSKTGDYYDVTASMDLSALTLSDNQRYYMSFRQQTGANRAQSPILYITKIWLA